MASLETFELLLVRGQPGLRRSAVSAGCVAAAVLDVTSVDGGGDGGGLGLVVVETLVVRGVLWGNVRKCMVIGVRYLLRPRWSYPVAAAPWTSSPE